MAIISSRPSVALVKTRWRKKGAPRTLADIASVIGANIWKISLEIFKHMEKEEFRFGSDRLVTEVMAEFTDYFDEKMIGLTGSAEQIAQAAKAWRVLYQKQGEGDDYLMAHTTFTYLVMPGHGTVEFFNRDVAADTMAERVGCFLDRS